MGRGRRKFKRLKKGAPFLRARVLANRRLSLEEMKLENERGLGNVPALSFAPLADDRLTTLGCLCLLKIPISKLLETTRRQL